MARDVESFFKSFVKLEYKRYNYVFTIMFNLTFSLYPYVINII